MQGTFDALITNIRNLSPRNQHNTIEQLPGLLKSYVKQHGDASSTREVSEAALNYIYGQLMEGFTGDARVSADSLLNGKMITKPQYDQAMKNIEAASKLPIEENGLTKLGEIAQQLFGLETGRQYDSLAFDDAAPSAPRPLTPRDPFARRYAVPPPPQPMTEQQINEYLPSKMQSYLSGMKHLVQKVGQTLMFTNDIADFIGDRLPQVKQYFEKTQERMAIRDQKIRDLQNVVAPVRNWKHKDRDKVNKLLRGSQMRTEWPFEPDFLPEGARYRYDPDSQSAQEYNALTLEQKTVVRAMFKHAHDTGKSLSSTMRKRIVDAYRDQINRAKTPSSKKMLQVEMEQTLQEFDDNARTYEEAYLPLRRWGEWAVVYKSDAFNAAAAADNKQAMRVMKQDPNHYQVHFAASEFQAAALRRKLTETQKRKFSEPIPRLAQPGHLGEAIPFALLTKLKNEVPKDSSDVSKRTHDALDRIYIQALGDAGTRQSELERLRVEGADQDMIRAFIEHATGQAALSAAIETEAQTRDILTKMKEEAAKPGKDRAAKMQAANETLYRHAHNLIYEDHPLVNRIMGGTSLWMLLSSPAYYVQNMTQPFMLTYPVLAGEFGTSKAMARLLQMYPEVMKYRIETKNGSLFDPSLLTDPSEQQLFNDLQLRGLLDVGFAMDLGSLQGVQNKAMRVMHGTHTTLVRTAREVELFNRGTTALASYRLKLDQLTKGNTQNATDAQKALARQYAKDMVAVTQGDYSGPNAPRIIAMLGAPGKLVFQFRKFQLIQIGLLARLAYNSLKRIDKESALSPSEQRVVRHIARKQFAHVLAMHGLVGGMLGLPVPMVVWMAIAALGGGEDEPADIELLARRAIGDKATADLLLRGVPAWLGVDASNRLGMGMTFSWLPFTELSLTRDGAAQAIAASLGPSVALATRGVDGIGQIMEGNVLQGTAALMPALLMNSIRAYEMATEGVRNRRHDVLMTLEEGEIGYFDLFTQAMGWPSKTLSDRFAVQGFRIKAEQNFRNRASYLRSEYVKAFDDGDQDKMSRIIDEWIRLQHTKLDYGLGTFRPVRELTRAPMERDRRELDTADGVQFSRTTHAFVADMLR